MNDPEGIRSTTGGGRDPHPGVTFGSTFRQLAGLADRVSYQAGDGNHDIKPVVHRDTLGANLGSINARVAGTNHPPTGMVRKVVLFREPSIRRPGRHRPDSATSWPPARWARLHSV